MNINRITGVVLRSRDVLLFRISG